MLNLTTLLTLTLIAVIATLFWRGQAVRERALRATRLHCSKHDVLLLDQTVALNHRRLRWSKRFGPQIEHHFGFEFTVSGGERYRGQTDMLGGHVVRIALEAHREPRSPANPDALH